MQRAKQGCSVAVIGAGVVGLQIAVTLLEEGKSVLVIADQLPGDTSRYYTSPWAGAQWRSHSSPEDREQQSWDRQSYMQWKQKCFEEHASDVSFANRSGLTMYPAKLVYEDSDHRDLAPTGDPKTSDGFWFRDFVDGFESTISASSPSNPAASVQYRSVFIDVPMYLQHLSRRVTELGGHFVRAPIPENDGTAGAINAAMKIVKQQIPSRMARQTVFVNATGLRARHICGDLMVHPVRGQVLVVKGVAKQAVTKLSKDPETGEPVISYVIPRPLSGVTILGGCNQKNNWSTVEDVAMTGQIKQRCADLAPELLSGAGSSFEVVGCQVGLRPARTGGARVEREAIRESDGTTRWVVHAYGHGGAGFQNSIGVAEQVSRLVAGVSGVERARL